MTGKAVNWFQFKGGSVALTHNGVDATVKFHAYVCYPVRQQEFHLHQAIKTGIVDVNLHFYDRSHANRKAYGTLYPVVKIFTSSRGFGLPQEYFSYFFLLDSKSKKRVTIKPLQFDKFSALKDLFFSGTGRFLTEQEIIRLYGSKSQTVLFFKRQTYIPASRLRQMVSVELVDDQSQPVAREVRMLRI